MRLEEAEKRDHRKLGRELDLFSSPGRARPGLCGLASTRRDLPQAARGLRARPAPRPRLRPGRARRTSRGRCCGRQSGHLAKYADNMYPPMQTDTGDYYVKPMNCPFHVLVYKSQVRSYRDLPMRLSELGHDLPPRDARRAPRAAPHPRGHAGRLAHHLHARSADRRDPDGVRADVRDPSRRSGSGIRRRLSTLPGADDRGRGDGRARHRGARRWRSSAAGSSTRKRPKARARSTGPRSTSTSATRSAGCGS